MGSVTLAIALTALILAGLQLPATLYLAVRLFAISPNSEVSQRPIRESRSTARDLHRIDPNVNQPLEEDDNLGMPDVFDPDREDNNDWG